MSVREFIEDEGFNYEVLKHFTTHDAFINLSAEYLLKNNYIRRVESIGPNFTAISHEELDVMQDNSPVLPCSETGQCDVKDPRNCFTCVKVELPRTNSPEIPDSSPPSHEIPEAADWIDGLIEMDDIFTKRLYPLVEAGLKATEKDPDSEMGQFWREVSYIMGFEQKTLSQLCDLVEELRTWEPKVPTTEDQAEREHEKDHGPELP